MSKDDDYIDIEVNLSSSSYPPPQNREFEFQMCSSAVTPGESPADELFYKGQLLPLHLPPRLKMVQKLLLASSPTVTTTPVSPRAAVSSPRRFSSSEIEVNGSDNDQCYFEISTELKRFIENNKENLGNSKKIRHSTITQKLKASGAYIKGLFAKPEIQSSKCKLENMKASKSTKLKNPFANNNNNAQMMIHRRSFSGVIQRQQHFQAKSSSSSSSSSSASSSLSSSFSFGSNCSLDLQTLMRSSNASSEIVSSIEGAIEHCKQSFTKSNVGESLELCSSRTSVSTSGDSEKG